MPDDEPWYRPLLKALVQKAVEVIQKTPADQLVFDAQFEDLPAKAPRKRRKALPPHSRARDDFATSETQERALDAEKGKEGP